MSKKLRISKNLIALKRGVEELLLANSFHLYPLYIQRGRDYVDNFLQSAEKLGTVSKIHKAFPQDSGLLEMLMEHKIIVPHSEQESYGEADIASQKKMVARKSHICLYLLLTQSCNLGCVYCLNGKKSYRTHHNLKMSEEVAYCGVEKYLNRLDPDGQLEIIFFGGEPLLNWPLAKKVICHCEETLKPLYRDRKISYHLTTNLAKLPDDLIEWAKKYQISFLCDVDGPGEVHNQLRPYKNKRPSFRNITENIRRLSDAGLKVSLRTTVTAINQHRMLETAQLHKDIGGTGCAFVPVNAANSDSELLPESLLPSPDIVIKGLEEVYHSGIWDLNQLYPFSMLQSNVRCGANVTMGCGAPSGSTPVIQANGDVYPCIYLVGMKRFFMGNVLEKIPQPEDRYDWMMTSLHVDHLEDCRACNWRYICGGSCPMLRFTVLSNPAASAGVIAYTRGIMCDYSKKVFELLLWEKAGESAASLQHEIETAKESDPNISKIC